MCPPLELAASPPLAAAAEVLPLELVLPHVAVLAEAPPLELAPPTMATLLGVGGAGQKSKVTSTICVAASAFWIYRCRGIGGLNGAVGAGAGVAVIRPS